MLARIAHELFWLGRNLSRAEHTARMLDGLFQIDIQARADAPSGVTLGWGSLMAIMGAGDGSPARRDDVLRELTIDPDNPASIMSCLGRAREGARTVRDVISAEMWEGLNTTHLRLIESDLEARLRAAPYGLYREVRERSALFWGLTNRTMLRDEASAFLTAGGRIEGGDMMLRMLRVSLPGVATFDPEQPHSDGQALALLHAVGAFHAFRRAVPAPPNAIPVTRFLLFERAYPDSVAAAVDAVQDALVMADTNPRNSEPVLRLSRLSADLEFRRRSEGGNAELPVLLGTVQRELALAEQDIADRYFAGAAAPAGVVTTA
jgi:uncharacterized alpha-E superfamily protein